jgi:hypothetical protein
MSGWCGGGGAVAPSRHQAELCEYLHLVEVEVLLCDLVAGDADGQLVRSGVWRIREWSRYREDRKVLGFARATNSNQTEWAITDQRGQFVATAKGLEGPAAALVVLYWGPDCLE